MIREWWSNVYLPSPGATGVGGRFLSRHGADDGSARNRYARIHVRLKPEGAPKRYRDIEQRWWWENYPVIAKMRDAETRP